MSDIWEGFQQGLAAILSFFYDLVPNYGVAIILLTIFINLVLFPLTLRQTRATRAFQAIQPEIRRIQKQYKDDPETLQKELMRVQREAGATPGGCIIPLLVQMPIWLALFGVLRNPVAFLPEGSALAANVEGATFLGMDLSTTPAQAFSQGFIVFLPYLLILLVMVASQYVQQWHAQPRDPSGSGQPQQQTQQAITRILPLFIGFVSWNFPAGLVVYWTTGNLFRLGQQVVIFRMEGRPSPPSTAAAAPAKPEAPNPGGDGEVAKKPAPPQGSAKKRNRRRRR